ncbi:MAG: adenylate/guanylate cyclase domain-containing protein [Nocardioides sp.]
MRSPRLRFEDPVLEKEFLAADSRDALLAVRVGATTGLTLTVAFTAIHALVATRRLFLAESLHAVQGVGVLYLLWWTFRPSWLQFQRNVMTAAMVVTVWTWTLMSVIAGFPSLYMTLAVPLSMVWLAALFRVGLVRTAVGSALMIPALVWTLFAKEATTNVWVLNFAFLANFYALALLTAYLLESGSRQAFLQRRLIRRFAPPAVVSAIETGNAATIEAPQRRRVTVLFSDVVGFTSTADSLDPESLAQIVQEYLAAMATIIERHGGTLNEFAGDGVMALFGAPLERSPEDQVKAATAAAIEIQACMPVLNQQWFKVGLDHELRTRVGINTGVLSVGTFGSDGRATYTGIGLQTNIAARIQAECDPGSILLSQASWHLIKDTVPCEERGEAQVKGVHFPIKLYSPVRSPVAGELQSHP